MDADKNEDAVEKDEKTLADEQMEQISGGVVIRKKPNPIIAAGAVGDMKKDPA